MNSLRNLIPLSKAGELCPPRRNGKKPAPSTLRRWAKNGLRGVNLAVVMVGNTPCTTQENLEAFFEQLTHQAFPTSANKKELQETTPSEIERQLEEHGL